MTYIGCSLVRLVRLSGTAPMLYLWFFLSGVRRVTLLVVLVDAEKIDSKKINFQLRLVNAEVENTGRNTAQILRIEFA